MTPRTRFEMGKAMLAVCAILNALAVSAAEQTVGVTGAVVDAQSGQLLASRVYVLSSDGTWFFPKSVSVNGSAIEYRRRAATNSLEMRTTLSAHPFTVGLPPGRYVFSAEHGPHSACAAKTKNNSKPKFAQLRSFLPATVVIALIAEVDQKDMPQLIVRQIEEKVVKKLKKQAGAHGISMEEEHRRILREALFGPSKGKRSFKEFLLAMPNVGEDPDFEREAQIDRPVDL